MDRILITIFDNSYIRVSGESGKADVEIPAEYEGKPVTDIGASNIGYAVFAELGEGSTVTLPDDDDVLAQLNGEDENTACIISVKTPT